MKEATTRAAYTQACSIGSLVLLLLTTPHSVEATDFFVRSGDVERLVAVINQANDEASNPGPDTINLEGGTYRFTEPNPTEPVNLTNGANALPSVKSNITINGAADTTNPTVIERPESTLDPLGVSLPTPPFRIFRVAPEGVLALGRLTITGGSATLSDDIPLSNTGGGILNGGTLVLTNSEVRRNTADLDGGGVENFGIATLTNSIVELNVAGRFGGGINSFGTATLTLRDGSIVRDNSAGLDGGGVENSATAFISDSIISNNSAGRFGGGIANSGATLELTNSTISGNSSSFGSGIENFNSATLTADRVSVRENISGITGFLNAPSSTVNISNSTLAQNANSDCRGTFNSQGSNVIGNAEVCNGFVDGVNNDRVAVPTIPPIPQGFALQIENPTCSAFTLSNAGLTGGRFMVTAQFTVRGRDIPPVTAEPSSGSLAPTSDVLITLISPGLGAVPPADCLFVSRHECTLDVEVFDLGFSSQIPITTQAFSCGGR